MDFFTIETPTTRINTSGKFGVARMFETVSMLRDRLSSLGGHVSNANEIIMQYGAFSALGMTLGLSAISGAAWWLMMFFSLWILRGQVLLSRASIGDGVSSVLARVVYLFAAGLSVFLAFAALFHVLSGERFAEKAFGQALAKTVPEINQVTATYVSVAGLLDRAAAHSAQMARLEEQVGGSCGPSAPAAGPIQRVRQADREEMAQLSTQFRGLADELTAAKSEAAGAVARYEGGRNTEIAGRVNTALDRARIAASDPTFQSMRSQIGERLRQDETGLRDPATGRPVLCHDPVLQASLQAVMAVGAPKPIKVVSLPETNSHRTAIFVVLSDLGGVLRGEPLDLELYLLPILLSPLPELAFLIGLSQRRRELSPTPPLMDALVQRIGLSPGTPWDALRTRLEHAANEPALCRLDAIHVVDRSWLDRVDYLRLPLGAEYAELHMLAHLLVDRRKATDIGIGPAGAAWADIVPPPQNPDALMRFVKLHRGVWRTLVLETLSRTQERYPDSYPHAAE